MVTTVNLSKNVASIRRSSFDLAAFFNFKTLYSAFYTFHFWHMLTPLLILERFFGKAKQSYANAEFPSAGSSYG
jgi:hypothetical protein